MANPFFRPVVPRIPTSLDTLDTFDSLAAEHRRQRRLDTHHHDHDHHRPRAVVVDLVIFRRVSLWEVGMR